MGFRNFLIVLLISIAQARNDCPTSRCNKKGVTIQSPFWLKSRKPQSCEPPGFNLSCNDKSIAILNLPYTGEFYVSSIYYNEKRVTLYDPNDCLPKRLLTLNLSSSPFKPLSYENFTFFSCPKAKESPYGATIIYCLSNTTTDIIATMPRLDKMFSMFCTKLTTVAVPVSPVFDYDLPGNLDLTWNDTTCKDCDSTTSAAKKHQNIHTTIMLSVVMSALIIPAIIASISCCICMIRHNDSQNQIADIDYDQTAAASPPPGLDKSTIETYKKITVGESRRIEGPNDATCTICLSDYAPHETIRFMPECDHCFHMECIDEWLSINKKCPVCRNSQTGSDNAC